MAFNNYDPANVLFNWKGIFIQGFASGSMLTAERNEDSFSQEVGATGDVVDVRSRNKSGKVTFRLLASASANDLLSAAIAADELLGDGTGPLLVRELNGTTILQAENARLMRPANVEYAQEHSPREWVLQCDQLLMNVGGLLT